MITSFRAMKSCKVVNGVDIQPSMCRCGRACFVNGERLSSRGGVSRKALTGQV